jgi:hypothetical protein
VLSRVLRQIVLIFARRVKGPVLHSNDLESDRFLQRSWRNYLRDELSYIIAFQKLSIEVLD